MQRSLFRCFGSVARPFCWGAVGTLSAIWCINLTDLVRTNGSPETCSPGCFFALQRILTGILKDARTGCILPSAGPPG